MTLDAAHRHSTRQIGPLLIYLQHEGMTLRIGKAALIVLALLSAESFPANKGLLTRLIVNLLMEAR